MGKFPRHTYDETSTAFVRNTDLNRRYLDKKAQRASEDTLQTVYRCPVCKDHVSLGDVKSHLSKHRQNGEVRPKLEKLARVLESIASSVEKREAGICAKCGVRVEAGDLKRHEPQCCATTSASSKRGKVWNAADPAQDRKLPQFGKGGDDIFDSGRVVSGGGPGTGKKR